MWALDLAPVSSMEESLTISHPNIATWKEDQMIMIMNAWHCTSTVYTLFPLSLKTTLVGWYYYFPSFKDEDGPRDVKKLAGGHWGPVLLSNPLKSRVSSCCSTFFSPHLQTNTWYISWRIWDLPTGQFCWAVYLLPLFQLPYTPCNFLFTVMPAFISHLTVGTVGAGSQLFSEVKIDNVPSVNRFIEGKALAPNSTASCRTWAPVLWQSQVGKGPGSNARQWLR